MEKGFSIRLKKKPRAHCCLWQKPVVHWEASFIPLVALHHSKDLFKLLFTKINKKGDISGEEMWMETALFVDLALSEKHIGDTTVLSNAGVMKITSVHHYHMICMPWLNLLLTLTEICLRI